MASARASITSSRRRSNPELLRSIVDGDGQGTPLERHRATIARLSRIAYKMLRSILCLVLLSSISVPVLAQETTSDTVKEHRSGTLFPVRLTPLGTTTPYQLMGTAVREKTLFKIKIYAFGLYVEPDGARSSLSRFAGVSASTLGRDRSFYRRILDMDFAMAIRLVMTRDVAGGALVDAFDRALIPRIRRAAADMNMPGGAKALKQFRLYFDLNEVMKGTEIVFSCAPAGRLETSVKGESRPRIDSEALCWALFDIYLGENPISVDGKKSVVGGVPELLAGEER